jgi:sugar phosphate isomerase/epimerase
MASEKEIAGKGSVTPNIGLSLIVFKNPEEVKDFIRASQELLDFEPYFELSYHLDRNFLESVSFLKGSVLSAHAPCPSQIYFPNLGSRNQKVVKEGFEIIRKSAQTVSSFGGSNLVLHPGYSLDDAVYLAESKRIRLLESLGGVQASQIWINEGAVCKPGYCETQVYKAHLNEATSNLQKAALICRQEGVRLCVENLNPRITYLFQLPEDLINLTRKAEDLFICLDIGHLWISSLVHQFDFMGAIENIGRTGRVLMCHIHDNRSTLSNAIYLADEHDLVGNGNVPVEKALRFLNEQCLTNFTVESKISPIENLKRISRMFLNE